VIIDRLEPVDVDEDDRKTLARKAPSTVDLSLQRGHAGAAAERAGQLIHGDLSGETRALVDERSKALHSAADVLVAHPRQRRVRDAEGGGEHPA